jgi:glycosyltransferase involved in cell wall biosynthesis
LKIIRIVPDFLPSDRAYGYFVTFLQLSLEQKKLGHEMIVLCKGTADKMEYINGIPVYRISLPRLYPYLSLQIKLMKFVEKNFADWPIQTIMHSHDRSALFLSYAKNRPPHVVHMHGLPLPLFTKYRRLNPLSMQGFLYNLRVHYLYKLALRKADAVISYSKDLALLLKNYGISFKKIRVVPNGVSETFFVQTDSNIRETIMRRLGFDSEDKIILFVGRPKWVKGIYHVLYAMPQIIKRYPSAKLMIIAGGGESGDIYNIKRVSSSLKISDRLIILPYIAYESLPYYYSMANVHVAVSFAPGYPKTILESLACGTPVIALRNIDTEELVWKNKCGYLVEEVKISEIASKINRLLSDQKAARTMGVNGRRIIREEFTWKKSAEKMIAIYQEHLR